MKDTRRHETATEARELVRRAVGDAVGLTIKGQLRQAARNLGYADDAWRLREAFYRRAGGWCSAALDDLRTRFKAWRERVDGVTDPRTAAQRLASIRQGLADLMRQVDDLAAEFAAAVDGTRQ